jgi:hypothetical protein
VVSSCAHIEAGMVPISVSLTDPNPDPSDPNIDVFRDDNWLVADVQRTSKRRLQHGERRKGPQEGARLVARSLISSVGTHNS